VIKLIVPNLSEIEQSVAEL